MKTVLGIGTYSISDTKMISIAERAKAQKSHASLVEHVWDKIVDYFCSTHREEAKRNLATLYSPHIAAEPKIVAFGRLMELAGEQYKANFRVHVDDGLYACIFLEGEKDLAVAVVQLRDACVGDTEAYQNAVEALNALRRSEAAQGLGDAKFEVDLPTLIVNGESIVARHLGDVVEARKENWAEFDAAIRAMCNEAELASIYALCDKQAFKVARAALLQSGLSGIDAGRSPARAQQFAVSRAWDGALHCELRSVDAVVDGGSDSFFDVIVEDLGEPAEVQQIRFGVCIEDNGDISLPRLKTWPAIWDPVSWTSPVEGYPDTRFDEWSFDLSDGTAGQERSTLHGSRPLDRMT